MARAKKRQEIVIAPTQARPKELRLWDRAVANSLGLVINNDAPEDEDSPAKAALRRAIGFFTSQRYKDALAACLEAIDLEPEWYEPHVWDGLTCEACGLYADAIAAFAWALNFTPMTHPGRSLLYHFQVHSFLKLGLIDDALGNCATGEAAYPGDDILKRARAKIQRFDRRYRSRITPAMMGEAYYQLGMATGRRSILPVAAMALRKALEFNPALDERYNITRLIDFTDHEMAELAEETRNKDVSESKKPGYDRNDDPSIQTGGAAQPSEMGEQLTKEEKDLLAAFRKVPEGQRAAALERLKAAAREITAAPRLKWGKDSGKDENPAAFAWRAYQAEAKAGTLHMGVIRQEDEKLAVKLVSWLRSPANRQQVPEGFDIPTLPEWNTRQAEARKVQPPGLYSTLSTRRFRARQQSLTAT